MDEARESPCKKGRHLNPYGRLGYTHPKVRAILVGAGSRGLGYATYATENPDALQIVAIAEPRAGARHVAATQFGLQEGCGEVVEDWRSLVNRPSFADFVIIATQDADHAEPTIAFLRKGYHVLVEKPMATTPQDCVAMVVAARAAGRMLGVCHVLRYTPYTKQIKAIIDEGKIGRVSALHHLEPIGYYHMAHSYVRGSWRNSQHSSPMLLAKCCHDLDWLRYICGMPIVQVSSMGGTTHFRRECKPSAAGIVTRCIDCPLVASCAYSAAALYIEEVKKGNTGFPVRALVDGIPDIETVSNAVRNGPYGRCVYECDNDQPDSQVVSLAFGLFPDNAYGSFTMEAFSAEVCQRFTRIGGSKGEILGDMHSVELREFGAGGVVTTTVLKPPLLGDDETALSEHWGADWFLMNAFCAAIGRNDPSLVLSGADESLETHLAVFAAEEARRNNTVVNVGTFTDRFFKALATGELVA